MLTSAAEIVPETSVSSSVKSSGVSFIGDCCIRSAKKAAQRDEVDAARMFDRPTNDPACGVMKVQATERDPSTTRSKRANMWLRKFFAGLAI